MRRPNKFDLAIIGCGPAGMAAGIYAGRSGLRTAAFDPSPGGAMATAHSIENYPGFKKIGGFALAKKMLAHAKKWCKIFSESAVSLSRAGEEGEGYEIITESGKKFAARAVIIATGSKHRELGIKGEKEFAGKGVSYCATRDGALYKGKDVAVIGGGDVALTSALYLSDIANKVYLIHRREQFRGEESWAKRIRAAKNIELFLGYVPEEICGTESVEGIRIRNVKTERSEDIKVGGVFICVGEVPLTALAKGIGAKVEEGALVVDKSQATNVPGIFAAGDVTGQPYQIVKAVAEGARAALSAFDYLKK